MAPVLVHAGAAELIEEEGMVYRGGGARHEHEIAHDEEHDDDEHGGHGTEHPDEEEGRFPMNWPLRLAGVPVLALCVFLILSGIASG